MPSIQPVALVDRISGFPSWSPLFSLCSEHSGPGQHISPSDLASNLPSLGQYEYWPWMFFPQPELLCLSWHHVSYTEISSSAVCLSS